MSASIFANLPLMPPPPGQHTDFNARAPAGTTVTVLSILTVALAGTAVLLRLLVKSFISKQKFTWDDGACLVALAAGIAHTYVVHKDLEYGLGKHMWNIRISAITHDRLLLMTSANFIICFNMLCVRLAVLGLYQRLFSVYETSKKFIYIAYFVSVLIALPELGVVIGRMELCSTPLAALTKSYCFTKSISIAVIIFAISGVFVDVYIYSIAIFRLRLLQVKTNKKIQLMILFGFGFIAIVFGLCNMIFTSIYFSTKDQLWFALWVALFKILEANIALTCACATFLPPLWKAGRNSASSVGSVFRMRSVNFSLDNNHSAKSSPPKERGSDEELVLPPSNSFEGLEPIIYTKNERSAHR